MNAAKTGALIAQMRKEKGLTQRELAERVYVSVQAVSKWELGKNFPDLSLMEPLSDILGLTVSELLAGERGEAPKDELVRDTLRLGEEQFRPKIKRWRGLFIAAAIVLAAVLAALGYAWLRDNTKLLPQRETVFTPIELEEEQNALVDLLTLPNNWDFLRMYRVALADGMDQVVFKAELWSQRYNMGPERELAPVDRVSPSRAEDGSPPPSAGLSAGLSGGRQPAIQDQAGWVHHDDHQSAAGRASRSNHQHELERDRRGARHRGPGKRRRPAGAGHDPGIGAEKLLFPHKGVLGVTKRPPVLRPGDVLYMFRQSSTNQVRMPSPFRVSGRRRAKDMRSG